MKLLKYICISGLLLLTTFYGCKDDEYANDTTPPSVQPEETEAHKAPGMEYVIKAKITEDTGLKSILIQNKELGLDEKINFGRGLVKDFTLTYPFEIPKDLPTTDQAYPIKLTVEDVSGKCSVKEIALYLNKDIDAPIFVIAPQAKRVIVFEENRTELPNYKLYFEMKDKAGLTSLNIRCDILGLNQTVSLNQTEEMYELSVDLDAINDYTFVYTLTDNSGFTTTATALVCVVSRYQPVSYTTLYLTDVFTDAALNEDEFGIPVVMDRIDSDGFKFELSFYNTTNNKEVLLLTDANTMSKAGFGRAVDGVLYKEADAHELVAENKITVPLKGYYKIEVDLEQMIYTLTPYTPNIPILSTLRFTGEKIAEQNDWWLADYALTIADSSNPYEIYKDFEIMGGGCFKVANDPDWNPQFGCTPSSGPNVIFKKGESANYYPQSAGKYRFSFNYATERAVLKKITE